MAINEKEKIILAKLIKKANNTQIKGDIWHELVKKFVTVSIELFITDKHNRVFMVYRKDREFDGYHIPGVRINHWETVDQACKRLIKNEIKPNGLKITKMVPIGWFGVQKDNNLKNKSYYRNPIQLIHTAHYDGEFIEKKDIGFFQLGALPKNTLECQKLLIKRFKNFLKDNQIVLGK